MKIQNDQLDIDTQKPTLNIQLTQNEPHPNDLNQKENQDYITKQQQLQQQPTPVVKYKSFYYLLFLVITYSLGSFYFGYCLAYISSIPFNTIKKIFKVDWNQTFAMGLIVGAVAIGAFFGSLLSHFLFLKLTRRNCILFTNLFALLFGGLVFIQDPYVLFFVRVGQGVCVGIYSAVVPVIVMEMAPVQISGSLGSYPQLLISFGIFFAFLFKYLLQLIANDKQGFQIWYYVFGFPLVTILLQTLLLIFVYPFDTPKYLIEKHKHASAHKVLQIIFKEQYVEEVYRQKLADLGIKYEDAHPTHHGLTIKLKVKHSPSQEVKQILQDQIQQIHYSVKPPSTEYVDSQVQKLEEQELIETPMKAKLFAFHIALLQQFCGVNAVVAYTGQVVATVIPDMSSIFPIIINFLTIVTNILLSFALFYTGRKPLLQLGCLINAFSTGLISAGFFIKDSNVSLGTVFILTGEVIYMANFGFTMGPIVWLYISQTVMQGFVPYAAGLNWLGAALIVVLFPVIKKQLPNQNPAILFLFFTVWSSVSILVNAKFMIQTKDKTSKQIYDQFKK